MQNNKNQEQINNNNTQDALNKYLKPKRVTVFAMSYCPYSSRAIQLLNNLNIKPEVINIDQIPDLKNDKNFRSALDRDSNISTFPKIYIGIKCYGGYTDLYDLFTENRLFEILKKANIDFIEEDYY